MVSATELEPLPPGLVLWRAYDPAIKTELFATGIVSPSGTYLIDPIPLAPEAAPALSNVVGIIVTNENHHRSALAFADRFKAPIHSASSAFPLELTAVSIEGAAPGEIAIHSEIAGGVMVIGDALINFGPYGFTFLPPKYCTNSKVMRRSLRTLLDYRFDRMFFAHGMPIMANARQRLEALLKESG